MLLSAKWGPLGPVLDFPREKKFWQKKVLLKTNFCKKILAKRDSGEKEKLAKKNYEIFFVKRNFCKKKPSPPAGRENPDETAGAVLSTFYVLVVLPVVLPVGLSSPRYC